MFKKILVAYDGSEHAERALEVAADLAKNQGAALHLAHVPQIDMPPIVLGAYVAQLDAPPTDEQVQAAGQKLVEKASATAKVHGVPIEEVHLSRGAPADHVLRTAEKIDADLIVAGRRGLGAVGSLALGSVSLAISHGAKCACLTVI
ncbi:MAG: universal stress protein [Sulfitobacter sp.]|nr:universal stress protein [Sulfitobacter sp.]